jgi:hypothetical protein
MDMCKQSGIEGVREKRQGEKLMEISSLGLRREAKRKIVDLFQVFEGNIIDIKYELWRTSGENMSLIKLLFYEKKIRKMFLEKKNAKKKRKIVIIF